MTGDTIAQPTPSADDRPLLPRDPDGRVSLSGLLTVDPGLARRLAEAGWGGVGGGGNGAGLAIPDDQLGERPDEA